MADHDPDTAPTQHPQTARGTLPAFPPVPRAKERSNGWKPEVQRAFIEALADTGKFDLLVMGSHGHGALATLVVGSVTTQVLAHCKVPLLIVR